jgi:ubiquinone/menaquinone biosynthesis C-methylase UbiE
MCAYSRWFIPKMIDLIMRQQSFTEERLKTLVHARGKVLEIGFGTGLNVSYYPEHMKELAVVDPNKGMNAKAFKRIAKAGFPVKHYTLGAESLPFPTNTFDCVTSTWTLCSISDVERALYEVKRVLRPGGISPFIEHGASPDPSIRKWQDRLTPLQRVIGDGCHLNRDIPKLVRGSGLNIVDIDKFYKQKLPRLGAYFYRGSAVK